MKPHIIIKLQPHAPGADLPHWTEILRDKSGAPQRFLPDIDVLLDRFGIVVWPTREHRPAGEQWSGEEIKSGLNRIYRLILRRDTEIPADLIQGIALIPVVEYVRIGGVDEVSLPPRRVEQLALPDRVSRARIYLPQAHQICEGDPSVTIAVLDTGVSATHPELRHAIDNGFDFVNIIDGAEQFVGDYLNADPSPEDDVGHGTHVTGIIAARGLRMPRGVAPRCRILPVRVLAALKRGERLIGAGITENIDAGIKWAADRGADVINMSLGIPGINGYEPHRETIDYAIRKGVTVVAATGNDGVKAFYYPGAFENVIAVGAVDNDGHAAAFSTYGPQVTLLAPGADIYSTYLDNDYAFSSGTSQAAPFVSGGVALLKSYAHLLGHTLTDRQVKHLLKHTADKVDRRFKHYKAGFGVLNLWDALKLTQYKLSSKRSHRWQQPQFLAAA